MSDVRNAFSIHHLLFGGWIVACIALVGLVMAMPPVLGLVVAWGIILAVILGTL